MRIMRAQAPEIEAAGRSTQCGDDSRADVLEAMQCFRAPGKSLAEIGVREQECRGDASGRHQPFRVGEAEPQRAGPDLLLIFEQAPVPSLGMSRTDGASRCISDFATGTSMVVDAKSRLLLSPFRC